MSDTERTARPGGVGGDAKPSPAAQRALAEAAERRARREAQAVKPEDRPTEIAGRGGAEPVRYGDWEVKGLAVDF